MRIFVTAKPNAAEDKMEQLNDKHYKISVKAPPVNEKANQAIIKVVATYFDVPKSFVTIISGHYSKKKVIEIIQ